MPSDSISLKDFGKDRTRTLEGTPRWWAIKPARGQDEAQRGMAIAQAIEATVDNIQKRQASRMRQLIIAARLYGNSTLLGLSGLSPGAMATPGAIRERLTDNVVQSIVDTATARVGENKPRPYFLTDGGSWTEQRKAKRLNKFADAIFYELDAYSMGSECQRDAQVFGDGLIFVHEKFGRLCHERVLSAEVWVDEVEALYGNPRQMHWVRAVDREELAARFPESEALIMQAPRAQLTQDGYPANDSDMVAVRESWHLSSGPESKDGWHCVSIDGHLIDPLTKWPHDFFPFARWRWCPRPLGYWSQGLCEQLQNKQIELNRLLWVIQESLRRAGTYKVLMEYGSKVVSEHLSNEIGAIVKWKGTKPEWYVPQAVGAEHYEQSQRLVQTMYERAGISIMSATGQKPQGLNSGEAQRVYRDTTAEVLKTKERLNADAFLELARIDIAMAREIAQREGSYEARYPSGRVVESIRMSPRDLDPSGWEMQCFPTSSLPKDPAGRIQTITEYIQAGFMTQRQGRRALDFPDLEAVESLANAAEDQISKTLDAICDEGVYSPPEPTDDLGLAKEMVVEYINRGRSQGLEDGRIDLLRTYSLQLDALMQAAQAPAMPVVPGLPAMGPGTAEAPPVPMAPSPLVPNVQRAA